MRERNQPVGLSWRVRERRGMTTVELTGDIDETCDFGDLARRLRGTVRFNLGEIRRINSSGVREWVDFIGMLDEVDELIFSHCSPSVIIQINMIYNFAGRARIRSFYAPYSCADCHREASKLVDVRDTPQSIDELLPEHTCEDCGGVLEFDEIPERYLAFLNSRD